MATSSYDPSELVLGSESEKDGVLLDDDGNELPSFDKKYAEPFKGLLYIGALTDEFEWLGHTFVIRTIKDGERLAVAEVIKPYQENMAADRAFQMGLVAVSLVSIDGEEMPIPIGDFGRLEEWARARFAYVRNNFFPETTNAIYEKILLLMDKSQAVVDALGKAGDPEDSTRL